MANVVKIRVEASSNAAEVANKASGAFSGLTKQIGATAAGFVAAQLSIAGAKAALSSTVGAAVAFESTMTKLETQVGISAGTVDEFADSVKGLAGETAQAPVKLAEGLLAITSAGIEGAESLDVLEESAKLSAIGLGETETVARALTAAVVAYADAGLTAAQASDQLLAIVQVGAAEADELAGSLGRVIGVASQVGVSFAELGGFIATFTRLGVSSAEAVTSLRSIMTTLLKPTEQASEALAGIGSSIEDVRQMIDERGFAEAMIFLVDKLGETPGAIAAVFPNIRALSGLLGTAGAQAEDFAANEQKVIDSLGATDKAMAITAETAEFKINQAMADLNVVLLEVGEVVLPAVVAVVEIAEVAFGTLGAAVALASLDFEEFNEQAKKPLDFLRDFVETPFGGDFLKPVIEQLDDSATGLEDVSLGAGVATSAFQLMGSEALDAATDVDAAAEDEVDAVFKVHAALTDLEEKADGVRDALLKMFEEPTKTEKEAGAVLAGYELQLHNLETKSGDLTSAEAERMRQLVEETIPAQEDLIKGIELTRDAYGTYIDAFTTDAPTIDQAIASTKAQNAALRKNEAALDDLTTATLEEAQARLILTAEDVIATEKIGELTKETFEAALATLALAAEDVKATTIVGEFAKVIGEEGTAVAELTLLLGLVPTAVNTTITADTSTAIANVDALLNAFGRLGTGIAIPISTGGVQTQHQGGRIEGPPGSEVLIRALAGETVLTEEQMRALGSVGSAGGVTSDRALAIDAALDNIERTLDSVGHELRPLPEILGGGVAEIESTFDGVNHELRDLPEFLKAGVSDIGETLGEFPPVLGEDLAEVAGAFKEAMLDAIPDVARGGATGAGGSIEDRKAFSLDALLTALGGMVNQTPLGGGLSPLDAFNRLISKGKTVQEALQIMFGPGSDFASQLNELMAALAALGVALVEDYSVVPVDFFNAAAAALTSAVASDLPEAMQAALPDTTAGGSIGERKAFSRAALLEALGGMVNRTPNGQGLDPLDAFNMWIERGKTLQEALQIMFGPGADFAGQLNELKEALRALGVALVEDYSVVPTDFFGGARGGGASAGTSSLASALHEALGTSAGGNAFADGRTTLGDTDARKAASLKALLEALGGMVNQTPFEGGLDPLDAFNMWRERGRTLQETLQLMFGEGADFAGQLAELLAALAAQGQRLVEDYSVVPTDFFGGRPGGGGAAGSASSSVRPINVTIYIDTWVNQGDAAAGLEAAALQFTGAAG